MARIVKRLVKSSLILLVVFSSLALTEDYELEDDEEVARQKYEKRRQELKKKHEEHRKQKQQDEELAEGEEWTAHEKVARGDTDKEAEEDEGELFTWETFMAEYNSESPEHPEVKIAKRYFPTEESTVVTERYKSLLKMYMDGTVHETPIDEDIREEALKQLEEFIDEYIDSNGKDEYGLKDLFADYFEGKFHDWVDREHPETDPEIEPDL
jgi:hypothetical protein